MLVKIHLDGIPYTLQVYHTRPRFWAPIFMWNTWEEVLNGGSHPHKPLLPSQAPRLTINLAGEGMGGYIMDH